MFVGCNRTGNNNLCIHLESPVAQATIFWTPAPSACGTCFKSQFWGASQILVALVADAREIGLEVSADKTKHMVMSRDQNAGRIQCEDG